MMATPVIQFTWNAQQAKAVEAAVQATCLLFAYVAPDLLRGAIEASGVRHKVPPDTSARVAHDVQFAISLLAPPPEGGEAPVKFLTALLKHLVEWRAETGEKL